MTWQAGGREGERRERGGGGEEEMTLESMIKNLQMKEILLLMDISFGK